MNGLTDAQQSALDLTQTFVEKLYHNGISADHALYEGYTFCQAVLRGDSGECARMDAAAAIIGRAALALGIHPKQQRAEPAPESPYLNGGAA